ncbi:hypothetical protein DT87_09820 [Streptomyces sp. NTK 937]|nr:hypothetical protein DT87_09820 [Streptomyces sp. NTK 937]
MLDVTTWARRDNSRPARTHLVRPADHGLRRVAVREPTPVDPYSLVWHRDNRHPAMAALRDHLAPGASSGPGPAGRSSARGVHPGVETWVPAWA